MKPLLATNFVNVTRSYGSHVAVKNLSFSLSPQRLTAFLGPNGAGKSTTLRLLLGLETPSRGQVLLMGEHPWSMTVRRKIGYTSQDLNYPAHLKVSEVLRLLSSHYYDPEPLENLKARFDLAGVWSRAVGMISGGERRRVGLAASFLGRPELLILDEPTTGLDLDAKETLWLELRAFRDQGGTILLCTHDLAEVERVADEVLLIEGGEKLFHGTLSSALNSIDYCRVRYFSDGETKKILLKDSDTFVRELVNSSTPFSHLCIERASLEEAFAKLRGRGP